MRTLALSLTLVAVACSDTGVTKYNSTPEVVITSHTDGDTVLEGMAESIRGQVGDPNHAIEDLSVSWLQNGSVICEDSVPNTAGVVSCAMTFGTDGGDISLEVRDPEGAGASDNLTLTVQPTDAPTAEITAPSADGVYYSDQLIHFQGTVDDTEDTIDELQVAFETTELGDIGVDLEVTSDGAVDGFGELAEGEHIVKLRVTDTSNKEGVDSVVITVGPPNSAPTCAITGPLSGDAGPEGELVTFTGTAEDVDVAADWIHVQWASDKDGTIGTSTPNSAGEVTFPYADLTVNTHVISMTVTDEVGESCADDIVYSVGTPPELNITAPTDFDTLNHSNPVVFDATVGDNEDLPNEVALSWESDVDGVFSTAGADSAGSVSISVDSLSPGDHIVTVTATDTDGLYVTDTVSFNLNEPPTTPSVTIEPDPAASNQMLVATASDSIDPEAAGTLTYAYEWLEDGVASTESISSTFPASATAKHRTYRVQVTANDGLFDSPVGAAEVTVINSNPVLSGPTLSAPTAVVGDVLTCAATATDADPEDAPTIEYSWSDGSTGPTYSVTIADAVDSVIACMATADDADGGTATGTASATVTNTGPTVDAVSVSPETGRVGDTLTCSATATDADGEIPTVVYAWSTGATGAETTITESDNPGDTITCTATATDSRDVSDSASASATVTNTNPVMDGIAVSPDTGQVGDTLTCSATATDADGEAPIIAYEWSTGVTGSDYTIAESDDPGDAITCTATATDEDGGSDFNTASATVTNTEPELTPVTVSPDTAQVGDTLTCSATATDADGEAPTIAYEWSTGVTGSDYTIAESDDPDDTITCTATATDEDGGSDSGTASATVTNTNPALTSVAVSPDRARVGTTLVCSATATDADGGSPTIAYEWSTGVTGSDYTIAESDDPDDTITCTATATDEDGGIDTETATATVANSGPLVETIAVSPETGQVGDTLTCSATASDDDGGSPTIAYEWSTGVTGNETTITESDDPGDTITCTATATDEDGGSDSNTASATVTNTDPRLGPVTVAPDRGQVGDTLTCTATASDADGGSPTIAYEWSTGVTGSDYTIAESDDPGSTITCTATATDTDGGSDTNAANATVINTNPDLEAVTVSPATATVGDTLTCTATATDADGGSPTIAYEWSTGVTGSDYTIAESDDPGDTITCTATATDEDDGSDSDTASATVANTNPELGAVSVAPETAQVGDTITCTASATDADGGSPTIAYEWSTGVTGSDYTIAESDGPGDAITCTATATDEDGGSDSDTASATVANTNPELGAVSVAPETAQVGDTITCTATATDADGGSPTIAYEWSTGATGADYTIAESDDPGDTVTCTATATDEDGGSDSDTASATVANTNPVVGAVSISPEVAYNSDTLTCSGTATDADGGSPTITYEWSGGASGSELPLTSIIAASGDTITCTATATDDDGGTDSATASITIANRDPSVAIGLTPASPARGDTISCSATEATDPDDDATTLAFAWSVDGTAVDATSSADESSSLAGAFNSGQTVACTATIDDGKGGTGSASASVVVVNTAPEIASVSMTPTTVYTNDTVTVSATTSDADGDDVTLTYAFSVDGTVVQEGASNALSGTAFFDKGQSIAVTVSAADAGSTTTASAGPLTVSNTAPEVTGVSLSPSDPSTDDTVTATATGSDADGDSLTYTYAFAVGGTVVQSGTSNALDGTTHFDKGETITVTVTASDGEGSGTGTAGPLTVSNSTPEVSVTLSPSTVYTNDTVTATATASDDDGDELTLTYAFAVDGTVVQSGTSSTLSGASHFDKGESIAVTVSATDGAATATGTAGPLVVSNTAPDVSAVTLTPSSVYTNDTLTAVATASDPDDDLTLSYAFTVGGTVVQEGSSTTLSGEDYFERGETVAVTVTASDGESTASRTSSDVTVLNSSPSAPTIDVDRETGCPTSAASFDGVDDYVSLGFGNELHETNFTVEAWVKLNREHNTHLFSRATMVSTMQVQVHEGQLHAMISGGGGSCTITSGTAAPVGEWFHIALASSYDDRCALYLNGTEIGAADDSGAKLWFTGEPWSSVILGGRRASESAVSSFMDGLITDFRIWRAFRTADTIADAMYSRASSGDGGLLGYWPFDEASGTQADDATGRSDGATLVGASWGNTGDALETLCSVKGLRCSIDESSRDADGDAISYTFEWEVDGETFIDTDSTVYENDTIARESVGCTEEWTCSVTANDGSASTDTVSASVTTDTCYSEVAAGKEHTCALKSDGSVVCWGLNDRGQLNVPSGSFEEVSVGNEHSCALVDDGTIACWGDLSGELDSDRSFVTVSAGDDHACGVDTAGDLRCVGPDDYRWNQWSSISEPLSDISVGDWYGGCGLRSDNTLQCWGWPSYGMDGVPGGEFDHVSVGRDHACGLETAGTLECFGQTAPGGRFIDVSSGDGASCGVKEDRQVSCWGTSARGALTPPSGTFGSVSTGYGHACGVTVMGEIKCWGDGRNGQTTVP